MVPTPNAIVPKGYLATSIMPPNMMKMLLSPVKAFLVSTFGLCFGDKLLLKKAPLNTIHQLVVRFTKLSIVTLQCRCSFENEGYLHCKREVVLKETGLCNFEITYMASPNFPKSVLLKNHYPNFYGSGYMCP